MKRAYAETPEEFENRIANVLKQTDREVDEYRERNPETRFRFDADGVPEFCSIPLGVASCPCCGYSLVADFEEWQVDDKQPVWETVKVDCARTGCFEEYQDSEYWRMPYVYWLPIETACQKWMRSHWQTTTDKAKQLRECAISEKPHGKGEPWVPVNEKLPSHKGFYWVTGHDGLVRKAAFYVGAFDTDAIAWLENVKPKPYVANGSD